MRMRGTHWRAGRAFTLVELQVALVVTGIILAAVVSLSFALNAAQGATEDLGQKQAVLRHADARVRRLIQQSNTVLVASPEKIQLWQDDDADGDPNEPEEYSLVQKSADGTVLQLYTLDRAAQTGWASLATSITDWFTIRLRGVDRMVRQVTGEGLAGNAWIDESADGMPGDSEFFRVMAMDLVRDCEGIQFVVDSLPPGTRFVAVQFDLEENGQTNTYQIAASLWCRDEHMGL
jgi:type II secretory pathway pseudopilin PulG